MRQTQSVSVLSQWYTHLQAERPMTGRREPAYGPIWSMARLSTL